MLTPLEGAHPLVDIAREPDATTSFLTNVVLSKSRITETINSWKTTAHVARVKSYEWIEQTLRDTLNQPLPVVWVRYGMQLPNEEALWKAWEPHVLTSVKNLPQGPGKDATCTVRIETADIIHAMSTDQLKVSVRRGKVSEIAEAVLTETFKYPVMVEPTRTSGVWYQSNETDFQFLISRMVPRAINDRGLGEYALFMKNGIVRFHTADYDPGPTHAVDYAGSGARVRQVEITDRAYLNRRSIRYATAALAVGDPYRSQAQNVFSDESKVLTYGNTLPRSTELAGALLQSHVSENGIDELAAVVQNAYAGVRNSLYEVKFNISGNVFVDLFDFIQMGTEEGLSWTGLYSVEEVVHVMNNGQVTTKVRGMRDSKMAARTKAGKGLESSNPFITGAKPNTNSRNPSVGTGVRTSIQS